MDLDPVVRPTVVDEVISALRHQITSRTWPIDSRIPPEPELIAQLKVSRGTLREAIRALAHTGLLEVRRGDGTYVRATSELASAVQRLYSGTDTDNLLEVRHALDAQAARLAATRATTTELTALAQTLERRRSAWESKDPEGWIDADWDFHAGVAEASHNPLLGELYRNLAVPLRRTMATHWRLPGHDGADPTGHEDLLKALNAHDPQEAARQAITNLADAHAWHSTRTPTTTA